MSYAFFLSYAEDDRKNGKGAVEWFFKTLTEMLNVAHGRTRVGDGGYFATTEQGGADWRNVTLPRALNRSHVLVCLYSQNYFDSKWCGKELEIFLQRRRQFVVDVGGEAPDCIIPVLWAKPSFTVPTALDDLFWKKPDGSRFSAEIDGLYDAYVENPEVASVFVNQLAKRISNMLIVNSGTNTLPPLPEPLDLDGICSTFSFELPLPDVDQVKATGPRAVTFVYPSYSSGDEFEPPAENVAVRRAAAIARSRELTIQGIEFNPSGDGDVVERVERSLALNTPVILMLTARAIANQRVIDQFSRLKSDGVATIVVDRTGSRVDPTFLGNLRGPGRFHASSRTDHFDQAVRTSLAVLRATMGGRGRSAGGSPLPTL